ncbi:hypothetical protein [Pseudomonas azotoformans]|uniref:Uncharacterized protein n=1 Tax=Pseudomonas azotoformans TaxID=47878 RepID=A0A127I167_PSEAZ|nr:hypothetical protein [Pseudomonas azotoformans]AMN80526.1 hypothetical protein AYR47_20380 [Pseudomonas azotoformans]
MRDEQLDFLDVAEARREPRPKGAHLFRVFSMKNHCALEMHYRTQLIEWARFEFDSQLVSFVPLNKQFKTDEGSLRISFKLEYLNEDVLAYVAGQGNEPVEEAFEEACAVIGIKTRRMGQDAVSVSRIEVWNRLKILAFITRWRHEITADSVKRFLFDLSCESQCLLSDFDQIVGFSDGKGMAFGLEMVRAGRFYLPSLCEKALSHNSVIICAASGDMK